MEFFKHNTKIDFMAQRKWAACISALLFLFAIFSLATKGLYWGLDFTGGTQVQLHFSQAVDPAQIRMDLGKYPDFSKSTVISYGTSKDVLVSLPPSELISDQEKNDANFTASLKKRIQGIFPNAEIQQINSIGAQVGKEMTQKSILAIFIALIGTMIYIALRFDLRFAIGSTIALIHDPVIILGLFSWWKIEFNLISLAAVLTVIGYSLNDTIVIFDRVRENFRKLYKSTPIEVMNQAINETLSRTIMTSMVTLVVVLALFFYGGSLLHGFSLALLIGVVVGTYSSIYVAGSLAIFLGLKQEHVIRFEKKDKKDAVV